ncbi:bifunctional N(6)-L-threonylcarbamoyladenine synthase/serine/threonine protein kinase [Candidatus Altiarchaeota archaeon]
MITLGFEGTAHTLGVGIVDSNYNVLADVRDMYKPPSGGIHPRDASQHMTARMKPAIDKAFAEAGISMKEVDLISFSQGPGLGPCLRTVATAARTLSLYHKKPIIGVNHCVAHIEVGKILAGFDDPLILYVSGANSQVIKLKDGRYRVFGETLDIGVGNMLDKFGRVVGLPHPAGPKIEEKAREGGKYIELPYVVKGTDLSFSGLLTAAIQKHERGETLEDVCYSLQETAFSMLCEVAERAIAHLKACQVVLAGGVGYNKRLQGMISLVAKEHDASFAHPGKYLGDNAVMIAMTGQKMHEAGVRMSLEETVVEPKQRTDDIQVTW